MIQMELEEGEINEDDGRSTVKMEAIEQNETHIATKVETSSHPGSDGISGLSQDEEVDEEEGEGEVAEGEDDDCVVMFEKPAKATRTVEIVETVVGSIPQARSTVPDGHQATNVFLQRRPRFVRTISVAKNQLNNKSLLANAVPAGLERTLYKQEPVNKKPANPLTLSSGRRCHEPNIRFRWRETYEARRVRGTSPRPVTRSFFRSKYTASDSWRSKLTRTAATPRPTLARQRLIRTVPIKDMHRKGSQSRTKSPSGSQGVNRSVEPSYEDLLAQYREIQSQLDDLGQEETAVEEKVEEDCGAEENACARPAFDSEMSVDGEKVAAEDMDKENVMSAMEYIDLRANSQAEKISRWDKLSQPRRRRVSSRSSGCHKRNSSKGEVCTKEEDDDDELELRRIALASAFKRKAQKGLEEISDNELGANILEPLTDKVRGVGGSADEQQPTTDAAGAAEDDEDILRAMLLSSLSNKQLEKSTKLGPAVKPSLLMPPSAASDADEPSDSSKPVLPTAKPAMLAFVAPPAPKHGPVVISLKDDTDSESDDPVPAVAKPAVSLISSIDNFLSEARQKVEQSKQDRQVVPVVKTPVTPSAVLSLPSHDLEEYRRLKAEIEKRERSTSLKSVSLARRLTAERITVTIQQDSNSAKTVAIRQTATQQAQLKSCESKLQEHSQEMLETQRELQKLKLQMGAKETLLKASLMKISKLKAQLDMAERVAGAQRIALAALRERHDGLSKDFEAKKSKKQSLQDECLLHGRRLYGDSFRVPQSIKILGIRRKSVTSTSTGIQVAKKKRFELLRKGQQPAPPQVQPVGAKRPRVNSNSHEMVRLKAMEQEIALKLQELRSRAHKKTVTSAQKGSATCVPSQSSPVRASPQRRRSFLEKNMSTKPQITQVPFEKGSAVVVVETASSVQSPLHQTSNKKVTDVVPPSSDVHFTRAQVQIAMEFQSESTGSFCFDRATSVPLNAFEMHFAFNCQKSETTRFFKLLKNPSVTEADGVRSSTLPVLRPYSSSLLHCRTYRFSPYFRSKANQCLTWPNYAHKLSPRRILCRFELTGTCNDDKCLGQHVNENLMTPEETLADIVSYCPRLVGVPDDASAETCKTKIEAYVEKLLGSNSDRMTHDQLCILTIGRVNEVLGKAPPHYITFDERRWHPGLRSNESFPMDYEPLENRRKDASGRASCFGEVVPDEVVGEGDSRYFSNNDEAADALEFAVLKSPNDANLWLRLAYKKLEGNKRTADLSLDLALNVLSRALEANLHNRGLWLHYLNLYSKRKQRDDLVGLCEQAIGYCPCYDVWWKFLQETQGYSAKRGVCKSMSSFVLKSDAEPTTKSHQALEVLLYDVQLNILSGRLDEGKTILEVALNKDKRQVTAETDFYRHLVVQDRCVLWLCYIHVVEFRSLPNALFDPANSSAGRIVRTTPFLLPWRRGRDFLTSVTTVRELFMLALSRCVRKGQLATTNARVCLPLYRNLIALEVSRNKTQLAINICKQLLETAPTDEIFLVLARMYYDQKDLAATRQTFNDAIKVSPSSPALYYFAASCELSARNLEAASDFVSRFVATFFDSTHDGSEDENRLDHTSDMYSQLLDLVVVPGPPVYHMKVSKLDVNKVKSYIWLCYCIWLETQGRLVEVAEAYEAAIVQLSSVTDLQLVWLRYLRYVLQQIQQVSLPAAEGDFRRYGSLVRRCLTSVPLTESSGIGDRKSCTGYVFFDQVVESYVGVLDKSQRIVAYRSFCALAPDNATLALRLLKLYLDEGRYGEAWSFVKGRLDQSPRCWDLLRVAIYLAKRTNHISTARLLYEDAVNVLPYNVQVWREFILFELANEQPENAKRLLDRCEQAGIVVDGIMNATAKE